MIYGIRMVSMDINNLEQYKPRYFKAVDLEFTAFEILYNVTFNVVPDKFITYEKKQI